MHRKALAGMVLVIVALLLIIFSMTMPWYKIEMETVVDMEIDAVDLSMDGKFNFYLDRTETSFLNTTETTYYNEVDNQTSESLEVFKTTQLMVYMGLVGCIVGILGAALVMVEKTSAKVGAVLVLIALILAILAPIYIMFMLPGAFDKDFEQSGGASEVLPSGISQSFFGSERSESDEGDFTLTTEYTWGGGLGWIFSLISVIILIIAMSLAGRAKKVDERIEEPEPQPRQAQQQPVSKQPATPSKKAPPPRRTTPPSKPATPPPSKPSTPPSSEPSTPPPPPPPPPA
jgi:hypothetical protein